MNAPEESPETEVACKSMRSPAALSVGSPPASLGVTPASTGMLASRAASGRAEGGDPASGTGWPEEGGPDAGDELGPEHAASAASTKGRALYGKGAAMWTLTS